MVELVAPAGDFETLAAAIEGGADSVYFGIKGLNMRSFSAENFQIEDIGKVAEKCHESKVKCFIALNTLGYNHEFPRVEKILKEAYKHKVDAIIASDMGVIQLAREIGINCHISTQASVSNIFSARFYAGFAKRIVLARELSLEQIKAMKNDLKKEGINVGFDVFVHGALCVAESGRCFMSQFHNRISANRGQCLHECRREYKITDVEDPRREFVIDNKNIMSPKDLCALPILDKLVDTGIDAFKIEGRAKGPEYVYKVTKVYKEAIKSIEEGTFTKEKIADWLEVLSSVYNRGFTTNFMLGTPTNDSWANSYGSIAKTAKKYVGRITNYYSKIGIAVAELEDHELCEGDTIAITGPTTGFYEGTAGSIHTEKGEVRTARKEEVSFPVQKTVRKNDRLFKIMKMTEAEQRIENYETHEPFKTAKRNKN